MLKLRFLIFGLLLVGALGQVATLRAQDSPEEPDAQERQIYLPAVMQGGAEQQHDEGALEPPLVVRVAYHSPEELETLLAELDVLEARCGENCLFALVSPAEQQRLVTAGRQVEIDQAQTEQLAASLAQMQAATAAGEQAINTIPGYACYRTVEETYNSLAALATAHTQLATWTDIGDSWEKVTPGGAAGYDIYALKLTNSAIAGPKPKFMLMAAIHAREYATAELATRFAEELIAQYNVDPNVTWLLDYFEIHIVPQVNPDGRKKAETGLSWRKNTDNNDGCNNANSWGTDLNRNSSFRWNNGGSSSNACDATYRGPSAASEPETQVIQNYAASIFPDQRGPNDSDPAPATAEGLFITLHSYGQLVLYPWGWTTTAAPNKTQMETLGRKFGYYNGYEVCNGPICLYGTSGTTDDYTYGERGVASYTFELGTAFFQSCSSFTATILPSNLPALYYAAKAARRPYQNPAGPDALNVSVSPATVTQGSPVILNATLDDTRYNSNGWGTEPVQTIAAGQYTLDAPSWAGGIPVAMSASDGTFNTTVENVTASIDTTALAPGRHTIFVEGQDANGNWGVLSAAFLWVTPNGPTPTPTNTPLPTDPPTVTPTPTNTPMAGNTGFLSPSANAAQTSSAGDNNGFQTNPTNAYTDGGVAVDTNSGTNNNSSCTNSGKDKHQFYNYTINLPAEVTVTGIEVRLDAFVDAVGSNAPRLCVQLSWDGGVTWTTAKQTPTLTTAEATYILGGAADPWGRTWTAANLTNTSFRLRVSNVATGSNATLRDFSLDWVAVRVHYQ
jgi:carboxypeptidase T